jgi:pyroglutamyl-peptidase
VAVCFGVHGSREKQTLYLERIARNRNESTADNAGLVGSGVILSGAAEEMRSAYPVEDLHDPLVNAGYSAEFSDNAGGYLCNYLYFRACQAFLGRFPVAFVHVPPVDAAGTMTLERLAQAVSIVARHAAFVATLKRKWQLI